MIFSFLRLNNSQSDNPQAQVRSRRFPLKWILIIPFFVQTLAIVGLVGYLSHRSAQQSVEKLVFQLMASLEHQVINEVDELMRHAEVFNRSQSAAIASGTVSPSNLNQLHQHLILQHRQHEELTSLSFTTPEGDFRASHRVSLNDYGVSTLLEPEELPFEALTTDRSTPSVIDFLVVQKTQLVLL